MCQVVVTRWYGCPFPAGSFVVCFASLQRASWCPKLLVSELQIACQYKSQFRQIISRLTIYARLAKCTSSERTQARNCQTFTASNSDTIFSEFPVVPCSCVEENGNHNHIDDSSGDFQLINTFSSPLIDQRFESRDTPRVKVLPSAVRWYFVKVCRLAVALAEISVGEMILECIIIPKLGRRHSLRLHRVWMRSSQNW